MKPKYRPTRNQKMPVEFTKYLLEEIRRIREEATSRKPCITQEKAGRAAFTIKPIP